MKRLVDETTDELARSLLQAGIEHRPPPGNKAQVIVALGAGGALGMLSSNAFAWLSTTAGKVTAVGVAVGVAGAVWVAVPPAGEARSDAGASGARVAAQLRAPAADDDAVPRSTTGGSLAVNSPAGRQPAGGAGAEAAASNAAATADNTDDGRSATQQAGDASGLQRAEAGDEASPERQARSSRRERAAARKLAARKRLAKARAREKLAASQPSERRGNESLASLEAAPAAGAHDELSPEQADLDREVRLVDDMHTAARRNDREALGRFLERYRSTFPDGQLKREVAEFAARLERPDTSIAQ